MSLIQKNIAPVQSVSGRLTVPTSKSYAQRAIALAALIEEPVVFNHLTLCDDVIAALDVVKRLGVDIQQVEGSFVLNHSLDRAIDHRINCGEAGLSTRLFSAFSLLTDYTFTVEGKGSILSRPMNMVIDALEQAGKTVRSHQGCLPLEIKGDTAAYRFHIDGSTSSQLLTGLLIVAPFLKKATSIEVDDLKSIPYIEMTLEVMRDFGLEVHHSDFKIFTIEPAKKIVPPADYLVEGDWSGASFLIVAGMINGKVQLDGLKKNSLQADRAMLDVMDKVGTRYHWESDTLCIQSSDLNPFSFDATHCPDLFPPLAALAAMIEGESRISGVHRLAHKESARASALVQEFTTLGIDIRAEEDDLVINGLLNGQMIKGGTVSAHNDHRMAMALTLLSMRSSGNISIKGAGSINKSYPGFFEDFHQLTQLKDG